MGADADHPSPADRAAGMPRRALLGAVAAFAPAARAAAAPPGPGAGGLRFTIRRGEREIGTHTVTFTRDGARLAVAVAIDIAVRVGPLTVFRLRHRATEIWQGAAFERIESRTDHDGRAEWMWAVRDNGFVRVEGSGADQPRAPADARPSTYWNRAVLEGPLLDAETGRLLATRVIAGPVEEVPVDGGRVRARRYELTDDADQTTWTDQAIWADQAIWYDLDGRWASLQMRRMGSLITYQRA